MSSQKLQPTRALRVIPSDNANIPFPNIVETGTNTSVTANRLVSSNATFVADNVQCGDIVYNTTDGTAATVVSVQGQNQVTLNADIFLATGKQFVVYQASAQTGPGNAGCLLYIGGAGNISLVTIGGDIIIFNGVLAGTYLPVQILKINASGTTATLLNALW